MQHLKFLRTISLLVVLALVTFGCATNKNQVENAEFNINAEEVPEGILITFNNLPSDITSMWVHVSSWNSAEERTPENTLYNWAAITNADDDRWVNSTHQLEKIKQTGRLIYPIIQAGLQYSIVVTVYNDQEFNILRENGATGDYYQPRLAFAELTTETDGIYFNRDDVRLEIDDTNTVVTLATEPIFTSDVVFDEQKYRFGVQVTDVEENRGVGIGDHHYPDGLSSDGLTWVFEPYLTETLRNDEVYNEWFGTNTFPARANVYACIIYDDIKWRVELTQSPEFAFSL